MRIFAAMPQQIYYPFQTFNFGNRNCFLTGEALAPTDEKISVFPQWLMERYQLQDRPFKMLDERMSSYADIQLPCSPAVLRDFLDPLEKEIAGAFAGGYAAVNEFDDEKLFQWAGKLLYGILFNEIQAGIKLQHAQGEAFNISQQLIHKFSNLHLMLQSINLPITFDGFKPFSLFLFPVDNATDEFFYRDEINSLTFSLRINDFGLIICLQDNGANRRYHDELLEKIGNKPLHPIQFEEICARIFYSAYLFNRLPEYNIMPAGGEIYIEAMPLRGMSNKPLFDEWVNKTYGQVLENFWKPWGFLLFEIIKNPELPITFLFDNDGRVVNGQSIGLHC